MTVELTYQESGHGTPLVLLHAFPLSSAMWATQHWLLADTCRLITPDQRGWGDSPLGDEEPSMDVLVDDLALLLDDLKLDRVVLGGLSMGGYVTMAFLRRYPERVSGLVLANTKAAADPEGAAANRVRIAHALEHTESAETLVENVFGNLLGQTTRSAKPAVADAVKAAILATPPRAAAWAEYAMAKRADSFDVLRAADVPALIIAGEEDALITDADVAAMAEALPDARVVEIPHAGHLTAVEDPTAFDGAVRTLLARV
ncbi:alpha/beta fold hydrolase [Cryptosporangium aurantiacum]|uniref:Pimeloyl-ACP methyl ester carboxylesterase n=1 Tax=Cryptosporangium aurantiacum TaxID=134849 RepID=A0A1M7HCB1_9ACTN|nr:alpha/beta hydrolase [Cryptosporangium aurantiacum]SHM26099.1 Pimeloyl-ACP methyl ester carboxylesterase [Cryptosporangium aurantiacum]